MADKNGYNLSRTEDGEDVCDRDPAIELEAARIDAMTFLLRGDYRNARIRANSALLIISMIPDGTIQGTASQVWDRPGIALFLEHLDKLEATEDTSESGGMVVQSYSYTGRRRSC